MGTALKAYVEKLEGENQELFQAVIDLKSGNKKAFEQIYKHSERYIYAVIYRIVRNNEKTIDLMQDTYIQIYRKIHTLRNVEAFFTWAGRIATHNTLRYIQRDSREVLLSDEANEFVFDNESDENEEFIPEDVLVNKEKQNKIREIINNLSPVQRLTVQYYYFGEMSVNEIAEAMECSPGTVKSRLNYARKQIKEAVIDTEKKEGIKLYSLSTLPLFALLLREEIADIVVPEIVSSSVVKGIVDTLGINLAGGAGIEAAKLGEKGIKAAIKKFFQTTGSKVASGVAAAAVAGTVAVTQIPKTIHATPDSIESYMDSAYIYITDSVPHPEDIDNPYLIDDKYLIFENSGDRKGIYTTDGEEILPAEYDNILYSEDTGGMFLVEKDDQWAYYDKSGEMICDRMYDEVGYVQDGLFWCHDYDSNQYVVYSVEGNRVTDDTYDRIGEVVNGLFTAKKDLKWGVIDKDGHVLADFIYFTAYLGDGEYIALSKEVEAITMRLTVLDSSGKMIYEEDYRGGLNFFGSGYYKGVAHLLGWYELPIKPDGTIIFDSVGTDYSSESLGYNLKIYPNGYFSYYNYRKDNGEITIFNRDAQEVAYAAYGLVDFLDRNNQFIIADNDTRKYSLIDDEGNTIIPQYDIIEPRYKGKYFICSDENGLDLYKEDGTLLYDNALYVTSIGCEMFECQKEDERLIINGQDGKSFSLSPDEYIASNYADGYAVKQTDMRDKDTIKYEIIDKKGKVRHKIKFPSQDYYYYENVIVLNEDLFSYRYEGTTYIKTW